MSPAIVRPIAGRLSPAACGCCPRACCFYDVNFYDVSLHIDSQIFQVRYPSQIYFSCYRASTSRGRMPRPRPVMPPRRPTTLRCSLARLTSTFPVSGSPSRRLRQPVHVWQRYKNHFSISYLTAQKQFKQASSVTHLCSSHSDLGETNFMCRGFFLCGVSPNVSEDLPSCCAA